MLYYSYGNENTSIEQEQLQQAIFTTLEKYGTARKINKVVAVPPDITRLQSYAGSVLQECAAYLEKSLYAVLPALGTHKMMSKKEMDLMYPHIDQQLFYEHRWRDDVLTLGRVSADYVAQLSQGLVAYDWPVQINKMLNDPSLDLILSIGQVVPHEVVGMANYTKNIFVGTGGRESIDKSHFLSAVCGIENILGRADTPVRRLFNYAAQSFARHLPLLYILTVVGVDEKGKTHLRGLFIGDDHECFWRAAELSCKVNITKVDKPLHRVVAFLDERKFHSTWLGNKAIYRSRLAMADAGELIIIAPGVKQFGEDESIDQLIYRYGYRKEEEIMALAKTEAALANNLSAVAHLLHGTSNGRFSINYAAPLLGKEKVEKVHYSYLDLSEQLQLFQLEGKETGWQIDKNNEPFYYIKNPALGLWQTQQ